MSPDASDPPIAGTIAICTRDRAPLLRRCLASIETSVSEPGQLEVLVVDNGSSDATPEVAREWAAHGPGRRVVVEARAGLSNARNRALAESSREVVLFTDDDALVTPGWGRAHLAAYRDPRVASTGGPVGLVWPAGRPPWMTDELTQWYGALELGDDPCPYPTEHGPFGVNMAVRRQAAIAAGGYEPSLGRIGGRLLSGEEPDLHRRLAAAGHLAWYVPAAGLVHHVVAERAERRWLLRRGWAQGVTNARLEALRDRPTRGELARRAALELDDARRRWLRRREGAADEEELAALARVAAHAAHGVELLRLSVRGTAP
jgi:glycosyltransferase involved in cell wall biosynthesis